MTKVFNREMSQKPKKFFFVLFWPKVCFQIENALINVATSFSFQLGGYFVTLSSIRKQSEKLQVLSAVLSEYPKETTFTDVFFGLKLFSPNKCTKFCCHTYFSANEWLFYRLWHSENNPSILQMVLLEFVLKTSKKIVFQSSFGKNVHFSSRKAFILATKIFKLY